MFKFTICKGEQNNNLREHPFNRKYEEFCKNIETLILGTFPPKMEDKDRNFDFYYHHVSKNKFWEILSKIFNENIFNCNGDSKEIIVDKIIKFLRKHKIGVCDIIQKCKSKDSADKNLEDIKYYDKLFDILKEKNLTRIILTSRHNSYKKSAEDWFVDWIEKKHKDDIDIIEKINFMDDFNLKKCCEKTNNIDKKNNEVLLRLRFGKIKINQKEIDVFVPYSPSLRCFNRYKNNNIIFDMYRISFLS